MRTVWNMAEKKVSSEIVSFKQVMEEQKKGG